MIPALSCSPSSDSTVALTGSSAIGEVAAAITTPTMSSRPATSGSTSQSWAGGVKGFGPSQPAGSRSTIGMPLATASRHASGS